jgi:hypothetical protein
MQVDAAAGHHLQPGRDVSRLVRAVPARGSSPTGRSPGVPAVPAVRGERHVRRAGGSSRPRPGSWTPTGHRRLPRLRPRSPAGRLAESDRLVDALRPLVRCRAGCPPGDRVGLAAVPARPGRAAHHAVFEDLHWADRRCCASWSCWARPRGTSRCLCRPTGAGLPGPELSRHHHRLVDDPTAAAAAASPRSTRTSSVRPPSPPTCTTPRSRSPTATPATPMRTSRCSSSRVPSGSRAGAGC